MNTCAQSFDGTDERESSGDVRGYQKQQRLGSEP